MSTMSTTRTTTVRTPEATLAYDVRGPLPTPDGRPRLLMIGQPMCAGGFATLASLFPERTVVTYDVRGLGRSTRHDGRHELSPEKNAEDVHAVIEELGGGPVEVFGSSGGAVTGLALVSAHPHDVTTLVAHEPPVLTVLPDADAAARAEREVQNDYHASGAGAGFARFIALSSWQGVLDDDYFAQPAPDPSTFGLSTVDDGSRDDPLLSGVSSAVTAYRVDAEALAAAPTRVVIAVGEETGPTLTGRTSLAAAALLGQEASVFPGNHGGFLGDEHGQTGQPEAFAARLREVLEG